MHRARRLLAALLVCGAGGARAGDQVSGIETDRPDQTECSSVVGRGRVQVEAGWTHAATDLGGITAASDTVPETLVRIGITPWLEGRVIYGGYGIERLSPGGRFGSGSNDMAIGFKFHLAAESAPLPEIALNVHSSVPIAPAGRTSGRCDPDFRFLLAHSLPLDFSLGYNLGMAWTTGEESPGDRDTTAAAEYTLTVGKGLGESFGVFVEIFGDAAFHGGPPTTTLDGGITYSPIPNLQFDVAGGIGLSSTADDWFAGLGISLRLPD